MHGFPSCRPVMYESTMVCVHIHLCLEQQACMTQSARAAVCEGVCAHGYFPFTYSVFVLSGIASSIPYQPHVLFRLGLHLCQNACARAWVNLACCVCACD